MIERYAYDTSLTANGGCYLCGSTNNLVSSGKIIEGEGLLALCGGCINDFALVAGYVVNGRDEIDRLKKQVETLHGINSELNAHADRVEAQLADLREQWVAAVEARGAAKAS